MRGRGADELSEMIVVRHHEWRAGHADETPSSQGECEASVRSLRRSYSSLRSVRDDCVSSAQQVASMSFGERRGQKRPHCSPTAIASRGRQGRRSRPRSRSPLQLRAAMATRRCWWPVPAKLTGVPSISPARTTRWRVPRLARSCVNSHAPDNPAPSPAPANRQIAPSMSPNRRHPGRRSRHT